MSLLSSLVRAYDLLPDKPPYGFAEQAVQFFIEIDERGSAVGGLTAFGYEKNRPLDRTLILPYYGGRSGSAAPPYFLWDNSAYVLGVSAKENFDAVKRHEAFRKLHLDALSGAIDPGLVGLREFLSSWTPDRRFELSIPESAYDRNIVFRSAVTRDFVHLSEEARQLWAKIYVPDSIGRGVCLVTGENTSIARIHPPIKTFENPARLVSFDKDSDAFSSYGHVFAENAPTGVEAAFKYTTILNRYLQKNSGHRLQVGDTSTVFWADCSDMETAEEANSLFAQFFDPRDVGQDEKLATSAIRSRLDAIRQGHHLSQIAPELGQGVRFHVLGLAPNAARLSVRFYWQGDFGRLTEHYQRFLDDTKIDPPPREGWPPLWRYLTELAVQGKRENVPPLIAGEWLRAILAGTPYPLTLLATVLMRIRADGQVNAHRAAILKSVLIRNLKKEAPVALDPANRNRGYILGRLFATYEEVQRAALGNVNASIRDKFYGSASATPQKVFRTLDANSANHFGKLRKINPGRAVNLEKLLTSITDLMEPGADPIPASLGPADQALFGIGYYHQRSDFFRKSDKAASADTPETTA